MTEQLADFLQGYATLPSGREVTIQNVLLRLIPFGIVPLGNRDRAVPERLANFADVHTGFQQFNAEGMPKLMRGPIHSCGLCRRLTCFAQFAQ